MDISVVLTVAFTVIPSLVILYLFSGAMKSKNKNN